MFCFSVLTVSYEKYTIATNLIVNLSSRLAVFSRRTFAIRSLKSFGRLV